MLFYLPVSKAWLKQVVLALVLVCHSSLRGVVEFFRDVLDCPIALGSVHAILMQAVAQVHQLNAVEDLSAVRAGGHDEIFQSGQPVLVGVDLDSTYCYLLAAEDQRDGETWAIHLTARSRPGDRRAGRRHARAPHLSSPRVSRRTPTAGPTSPPQPDQAAAHRPWDRRRGDR